MIIALSAKSLDNQPCRILTEAGAAFPVTTDDAGRHPLLF